MNPETVVDYLVDWLREQVAQAGVQGVVLGVSGGLDSAVAAVIAHRAFPNNCMALILPCESQVNDRLDSQMFLEEFNIPYRIVELDNAYRLLLTHFESYIKMEGFRGRLLRANIKPRLRMITLYYSAQGRNSLVLGTSNKSELSVGYSTKHGDAGVDLQLLGDLLKTEVYELARYLKIPDYIINKTPSGGLWEGQSDEEEMGITYRDLDLYLSTGQGDPEVVKKIETMRQTSEHKRRMPPIPIIPRD
ncbi:MAG: NAD(+) synthase [Syntrophomonadaceae bacterium]|jgi:NAD+ synthase|nr:NAD(+) synthase [Bacillota bacterium]NLP23231.1 NAD(+) synthase [Syntrophomonadaceae bacterium]